MEKSDITQLLQLVSEQYTNEVTDLRAEITRLEKELEKAQTKIPVEDVSDAQKPLSSTKLQNSEATVAVTDSQAGQTPSVKPGHKLQHQESVFEELEPDATDTASKFRERFENYIDIVATVVVVFHIIFLIIQMQYNGSVIAEQAGFLKTEVESDTFALALTVFDHVFNAFFVLEMGVRIFFLKKLFFLNQKQGKVQWFNIAELSLVCLTSIDLYAGGFMDFNFNSFRPIVRFIRLLRMLRVLKLVRFFFKLRVLVTTVAASFLALFWSIVLLVVTMLMAALFLNQSLVDHVNEKDLKEETREWIYLKYGTSTRAFWTVFELTFSGGWPNYSRTLVEEVHFLWAFFFFFYIIAVVFAMFRIITALFLRDTLALAANDAETAIREKNLQKEKVAHKLRDFFEAADTSGDGMLTQSEFEIMCQNPKVRTWLSLLELDVNAATEVFSLFEDEDNNVSCQDFVQGMMKIKGQAKAQEVYNILIKQRHLMSAVTALSQRFDSMEGSMRAVNEKLIGV